MRISDVIRRVHEVSPPFNHYAMSGFAEEHINNSPKFVEMLLREGCKIVDADLEVKGLRSVTPEQCVTYEIKNAKRNVPIKVSLTKSNLRLHEYEVRFGTDIISTKLYTPFMQDNLLVMSGRGSMVRKVFLEKTFSLINNKNIDGISFSPVRVNMNFHRMRRTKRIFGYVSGNFYIHSIITAKMYNGKIKRKVCEPTIIHYILAKFGFIGALKKFGIPKEDVNFVGHISDDTDVFEYFAAVSRYEKDVGPGLFVKVRKTALGDDLVLKFVVNLMYVLDNMHIQSFDPKSTTYVFREDALVWKTILGIVATGAASEGQALPSAKSHLLSADYFLDPITLKRLEENGIVVKDTYDLIQYIFIHIDEYMVQNLSENVYNSRLDVVNLLIDAFSVNIFKRHIYVLTSKTVITKREVEAALKINAMMFKNVTFSSGKDDDKSYITQPSIVGDNFLLSGGLHKIRMGATAEQRIHPSMMVTESTQAFSGKTINKTGYANPYLPIKPSGSIYRPDYADAVDEILPFLPS